MTEKAKARETYAKPELVKHDNLKDITFECPNWQGRPVRPPLRRLYHFTADLRQKMLSIDTGLCRAVGG
jgi:hypothetical protein